MNASFGPRRKKWGIFSEFKVLWNSAIQVYSYAAQI